MLRRGLLRNLLVQNAPVEPVLGQQMAKILDDCQNNVQGSEMIDKTMNLRFGVFRHVSSRGHNSHVRVLLFPLVSRPSRAEVRNYSNREELHVCPLEEMKKASPAGFNVLGPEVLRRARGGRSPETPV